MQLFRPEAMRGQDRLHGDVVLVPPVSWQVLGGFLLASIAAAALFLATAQYGKVTTVTGRLTGDRGVLRAVPTRAGIVEQVLVREGQQVEAGAPLVRIAIATRDGAASLEERRSASIAQRDTMLRAREPEVARGDGGRGARASRQMRATAAKRPASPPRSASSVRWFARPRPSSSARGGSRRAASSPAATC